jgi:hypothetical protein
MRRPRTTGCNLHNDLQFRDARPRARPVHRLGRILDADALFTPSVPPLGGLIEQWSLNTHIAGRTKAAEISGV